MRRYLFSSVLATTMVFSSAAFADDSHVAPIKDYIEIDVMEWVVDPVIITAIKKQNQTSSGMSEDQIVELDNKWRAETKADAKPMIDEIMARELSKFLKEKQDASGGLISEVFVMDNKGMNVGQSAVTSDYWQGDEAKWKKTFLVGPDAVFIDGAEVDDSTGFLQFQASLSIKDPDNGEVIGAITLGINIDAL